MKLHKVKLILSQWKQFQGIINMEILIGTVNGEKENVSFYRKWSAEVAKTPML